MPRPRLIAAIPVALVAFALLAAGCGGDDDEALTKDEYLTLADEICAEADIALDEEAGERSAAGTLDSAEQQEAFAAEVFAPNLQGQLDSIRELTPPEEDQEQVDEILAALEDLIAQARDNPQELFAAPTTEAAELAQAYGFTACGT